MRTLASKIDANVSMETKSIMASVEVFKSAVLRIRDIFRGLTPSITGMESMRHLCLYLMGRFMTKDKVKSLGVPEEFAWENLIETAQTKNGGVQKALDYFFHKETDCLVHHFDRLFGTRDFSFDIKNPAKHKEILDLLSTKDINIETIDLNMDILGWVYEQHLSKGSGGNAMRDLGQFFTDRSICDYMVSLCKPGFKSKGVPESVCDPSMGTGGFLTSYMKFYKKHHADTPVEWSVQTKEIHGCDTDQKVAGVARLNLFMESGGTVASNLLLRNSLQEDLIQNGYDLILANMPFGLKGLKHKDCCQRVKDLKLNGTKSEPLFLQLMMVSLNRGGRCAVVVPDGMLVNGSSCHDETRKYLLDHFQLKRVIKMKGPFFMNTGIQPSILFFENTGKPTTAVEFWDVVKGANGPEETLVLSVPREKFDASCSFDMRRYQEVKAVANPAGFPTVKVSDVCTFVGGRGNQDRSSEYTIPYYESNGIFGFVKEALYTGEYIITARCMSIGAVHYVNGAFYPSDHTITMTSTDTTKLNNRFLYFWLLLHNKVLKDMSSGIKPGIRKSDVMEIKMPLPPLETQQEIVATLDRIYAPGTTELTETLTQTKKAMDIVLANSTSPEPILEAQRLVRKSAQMVAYLRAQMVADVKAQMTAIIMASMNSKDSKKYRLSDIADDNPESITKSDTFDSIEYIDLGSVKEGNISNIQTIPFADKPSRAQRKVKAEDILWGGVRPLSKSYAYISSATENTVVSSGFVVVRNKNTEHVLSKYLYYTLTTDDCIQYLNSHSTGTSYPAFNSTTLMAYEVMLPSIEIQRQTLQRLNALQVQLTSLENLGKQAEDNARFIMDSYLNTV